MSSFPRVRVRGAHGGSGVRGAHGGSAVLHAGGAHRGLRIETTYTDRQRACRCAGDRRTDVGARGRNDDAQDHPRRVFADDRRQADVHLVGRVSILALA